MEEDIKKRFHELQKHGGKKRRKKLKRKRKNVGKTKKR